MNYHRNFFDRIEPGINLVQKDRTLLIEKGKRILIMSSFFDSTVFNSDMTVFFTFCRDIFNFSNTSFRNFFVKTLWFWVTSFMLSVHIEPSLIVIRYCMNRAMYR